MRDVTVTTTVYRFSELDGKARDQARQWMTEAMSDSITEDIRTAAADFLTNEGWTDLAELRWSDNGPDLERMQFSISHSQGDFVAWASRRPVGGWTGDNQEVFVVTTMRHTGGGYTTMDVETEVPESPKPSAAVLDHIQRLAVDMVNSHRATVLSLLRDADMAYYSGEHDEWFAETAEANEWEFTASGEIFRS